MTSIFEGLRRGAVGGAVMGMLVLPACDEDDGSDTQGATSAADTGMETGMGSGGQTGDSTGSGDTPTHSGEIQAIWDEHCTAACHEAGGEWALLDLTDGNAYAALMAMSAQASDLKFVEPGDVDASYLWHKINNTQMAAGGGGVAMPKARTDGSITMLTPAQLDAVEAWIAGGAPE